MGYEINYFPHDERLLFFRMRHVVSHLYDIPILPFNYSILKWSIRIDSLSRDVVRSEKWLQIFGDIFISSIIPYTLNLPLALNLNYIFEFHKLPKHLTIGFNGVHPKKYGKIISKGEVEILGSPKIIGGHGTRDITMMISRG
jgi:hypothetical protein